MMHRYLQFDHSIGTNVFQLNLHSAHIRQGFYGYKHVLCNPGGVIVHDQRKLIFYRCDA